MAAISASSFSSRTATSIVIANMIGTGVFTSLGFQLLDIDSAPVIIALWVIGGVLGLCGALCYAELGAALPRSGGEYNYLTEVYHPGAGFIAGWVSATCGFAAPTALAAMTAGVYVHAVVPAIPSLAVALTLVVVTTVVHLGSRRSSGGFQLGVTAIKVVLIGVFVLAALLGASEWQDVRWQPVAADLPIMTTGAVAVALIYVNYAYTGWNAATYLVSELDRPDRHLPRILLVGTGFVTLLYVILHVTYLLVAPMEAMRGEIEIGYIVADFAFGDVGRDLVGVMLGILLVSTVSAMMLAGPRALQVIGQDFSPLRFLSRENRHGVPAVAIAVQGGITVVMLLTAAFETVLLFAGFILGLNTLAAVVGVIVLRVRRPDLPRPFRVPWYPLPVLIFIGITGWTLVYVAFERPVEVLVAAAVVGAGWLFYLISRARVSG